MACSTLFGVCLLACVVASGLAAETTLEAETFATELDANRTIPRSNASNYTNVLLYTGENITFSFCLDFDDTIQFLKLYYSNDGTADVYDIYFDGQYIGSVTSSSNTNEGYNWNNIESDGPIGQEIEAPAGRHTVTIAIEADVPEQDDGYGAEIDSVVIQYDDNANGDLSCVSDVTAETTVGVTGTTEETSAVTEATEEASTQAAYETTQYVEDDCEGEDC